MSPKCHLILTRQNQVFSGVFNDLSPKNPESCDKFKSSNGAGGESKAKCTTPTLTEEQLKEAFDRLLAKLAVDKEVRIRNLWDVYKQVGDVSDLEGEKAEIIAQRDEISDLVQQAIRQNATVAQDQEAYNNHYDGLALKDAELAWKIGELEEMMVERGRKAERVETFIRSLEMAGEMLSEELWCTMVERVKVERDGKMMFTLTCGMDVEV